MTAVPAAEPRAARGRAPGGPTWDEVRRPHWQRFRLVVAVGWALVLVAVLLTGVRESSMPSLLAASYDGQVSDVRVSGHGLPAGSRGYEVVEVRWRHGLFDRVTQVVEARPRTAGRDVYLDYEAHPVVTIDAVAYLRDHTDGVRVTRAVGLHSPGSSFGGWHVPGGLLAGAFALFLATLYLLVNGPRPWRATRWAWFWLLWVAAPIGVPAFLLLSGPVPGLPRPRPGTRRLTGGRSFLLASLVLAPLLRAGIS